MIAQSSASRRFPVAVIVFSAAAWLVIGFGAANFRPPAGPVPYPFAGDFLQEYAGGWLILHGDRSRFYDLDYAKEIEHDPERVGFVWQSGQWFPMIYPPFWYLLVSPLYLLPIRAAALVWLALMIAALAVAMVLLARHFPERSILIWAIPAGFFFPAALESLTSGQKGTLLLLILTASWRLLAGGKQFAAGVVFGLIAFKPHLGLVIGAAMLCKRQWPFVAGSLLTVSLLVGLCFGVGSDVCRQYFELSLHMGRYIETPGYQLARMHSWYGFVRLLMPEASLPAVWGVAGGLGLATIAVVSRLLWPPFALGQPGFALQYSGLVLATLLLSPHLYTYDLTALLLPLILLILHATEADSPLGRFARPSLWLVAILFALGGLSTPLAEKVKFQCSVPAMFLLLIFMTGAVTSSGKSSRGHAAAA